MPPWMTSCSGPPATLSLPGPPNKKFVSSSFEVGSWIPKSVSAPAIPSSPISATDRVVAPTAFEAIVTGATRDPVTTAPSIAAVGARSPVDFVLSGVFRTVTVKAVASRRASKPVRAPPTIQVVTSRPTPKNVAADSRINRVDFSPRADQVVTAKRLDDVFPAPSQDDVGFIGSVDLVISVGAGDRHVFVETQSLRGRGRGEQDSRNKGDRSETRSDALHNGISVLHRRKSKRSQTTCYEVQRSVSQSL